MGSYLITRQCPTSKPLKQDRYRNLASTIGENPLKGEPDWDLGCAIIFRVKTPVTATTLPSLQQPPYHINLSIPPNQASSLPPTRTCVCILQTAPLDLTTILVNESIYIHGQEFIIRQTEVNESGLV